MTEQATEALGEIPILRQQGAADQQTWLCELTSFLTAATRRVSEVTAQQTTFSQRDGHRVDIFRCKKKASEAQIR